MHRRKRRFIINKKDGSGVRGFPKRIFAPFRLAAALAVALSVTLTAAEGLTQQQGFMVTNETAPIYRGVPEIENQLYGHAYPNQPLSRRIVRIERTLFGHAQGGPLESRMERIRDRVEKQKAQQTLAEQEPMLAYLEDKLFQRTFEDRPLPDRMQQLELQVFGQAYPHYPMAVRMKKLTYAMPLMAKEIRLSSGGMVIASTARASQKSNRSAPPQEVVQLDATKSTHQVLPQGITLSTGDYFRSLHRNADGTMMRWAHLPIRVYIKPGAAETTMTLQALEAWQRSFSVEQVGDSREAHVVVSWHAGDWERNQSGLLTRPVLHMDTNHQIRSVILITMHPLKGQPPQNQLHALSHQLGHAFGLWGHSDNPGDIMYPLLDHERKDFPRQWAYRSSPAKPYPRTDAPADSYSPSQRDINTLLKVYDEPVSDISTYNPY